MQNDNRTCQNEEGGTFMGLIHQATPDSARLRNWFPILGREADRPRELSKTAAVWDALVSAAIWN